MPSSAGEGDIYVAGGVESVSRYANGFADEMPGTHNPRFEEAEQRSANRALGGSPPWAPAAGLPDIYIAMGQTAENVRERVGSPVRPWTASPSVLSSGPSTHRTTGFFTGRSSLSFCPTALRRPDDSPRRGTDLAAMAELKPAFRPTGR